MTLAFDTTQVTSPKNYSRPKNGDPCHPLASGAHPPCIALQDTTTREKAQNGRGWSEDGTSYTLDAAATQGVAIAFANRTRDGVKVPEVMPDGITPALTNPGNGGRADAINVVAVDCYNQATNETSQAISSAASDINHTGGVINPAERMAVRRLTPRECERLQGFKDDHTLIPWRGKPADQCPDGPRYKALGNSMAVPCMEWIGQRIAAQEMFPLRYLSVCSGIEAASVAWEPLGWQPAAFAEVERFPSAVLAHHWPDVPNLGDMTQYEQWKELGAIDLLVGGTPCQSFSVAGLRQGLRDPRGGLMLTYLEIATSFRPRWLVWENVPGVLSSHGGRDFGAFLGALGALGYGWAYRVLDAQWFGVAQRRRRVFVVANLGDGAAAAKVLFESESVRRNPAPSREAGQRTAATLVRGSKRSGGIGYDNQAPFSQNGDNFVRPSDYPETVGTLSDGAHNGGGLNGQDAYSGRIFAVSAPAAHNTIQ
jgi:site-specific DNA-cytosine methylase